MIRKALKKMKSFWFFFRRAAKAGAYLAFLEYLLYRTPLAKAWARLCGHRFHRSAMAWFVEKDGLHTRVAMLLPSLQCDYAGIETLDMSLEFYSGDGRLAKVCHLKDLPVSRLYVLDTQSLPEAFDIPKPFDGVLLIKQTFHLEEKEVFRVQGLFGSAHNYIDYYREGSFVTTLHDYSAYLPDQGMNYGLVGMIQAYCSAERETFLLFLSADAAIGGKDLEIFLINHAGEKKSAYFPGLKPFRHRRIFLTELFLGAEAFLGGRPGQVVVDGFFRKVLRRVGAGILDKKTGSFSLAHCFYSVYQKLPSLSADQRRTVAKGWFNPFLVLQDDRTDTAAYIFHHVSDADQEMDLLVYDAEGRCVLKLPSSVRLTGDAVARIDFGEIFRKHSIRTPFMGHAEFLYHQDARYDSYPKDLNACIQYGRGGNCANVIIGAEPWNPPKAIDNKLYNSACRVVCDEAQTTYLGISNCSFSYEYDLEARFNLNLVAAGKIVATRAMTLAPNATIYLSVEEIFPDARKLLTAEGGVGYTTSTHANCWALAHLFFTEDRVSGALSVEHSSDAGIFA